MLDLERIDVNSALKNMGGDRDMLRRVLLDTRIDQRDVVVEVRQALSDGRQQDAHRYVHSLYSIAGMIGAAHLQDLSSKCETLLKVDADNLQVDSLSAILSELEQEFKLVFIDIGALLIELGDEQEKSNSKAAKQPEHKHRERAKILVVDDIKQNLDVIKGLLSDSYNLMAATNGVMALKVARSNHPDLILLDIMMPDMDGYEVCKQLKADQKTADIAVVFLTAKAEIEDEEHGFELGAVDYITKPISPPILKARVKTHLENREYSKSLEQMVESRTLQLAQIQDATILAMGALAEQRDPETGNHIRRTQGYVKLLAEKIGLADDEVELIYKSAPLHDIGKVAVPDSILKKPGKLTTEEFKIMQHHAEAGRDVIVEAEVALDDPELFLIYAKDIAYRHHEKWDGSGYPNGLAGRDIPLCARIMALADVYDALVSRRIYKPPFDREKTNAIIVNGRGIHFDPSLVDAFLELEDQFYEISQRYIDSQETVEKRFNSDQCKILLVDDSSLMRGVIRKLLEDEGVEVDEARDGIEGVERATHNNYTAIFMDLEMPDMNGDKATELLRRQGCSIPIIALTGAGDDESRNRFIQAGATGYMQKPLDPELLKKVLSRIVG